MRWIVIRRLIAILFVFLCLTVRSSDGRAADIPASHPSLRAAALPPLIPASEFYGRSYKNWWHQISPDGKRLAWVKSDDGKRSFQVRLLDDGRDLVMTHLKRISTFHWALDSRHVLFPRRVDRHGNRHLFLADTDSPGSAPRDLTPYNEVNVRSYLVLLGKPERLAVTMNLLDRRSYDLYEIDTRTGEYELRAVNDGATVDWIVNHHGDVVARLRRAVDGAWSLQATARDGEWNTVLSGTIRDTVRYGSNIKADSTTVFVQTDAGRDKQSVTGLNLVTGMEDLIFEAPETDVSGFWIDLMAHQPLLVRYFDPLPRYHFLDPELQRDLEKLMGTGPILYNMLSGSLDHARLLLLAETDRQAPSTYLLDRKSGTRELLAAHAVNKYASDLPETRPIRFVARDGLQLNGFLTLPKGTSGKRLPTVLKVHGGPWLQDQWGFDTATQFLANRGYAVLEVNFRGSTGFGRGFMEKGRRELGRRMQTDLIDAVDWAITQGYSDPERIAIYGHSYGGYAALMGLALTPGKFAAGISINGVTDLALLVDGFRAHPEKLGWWLHFAGDTHDIADYREMKQYSPVTHASRIRRPLLILHGARDSTVPKEHFDRLLAELRKGDAPLDYLVFPDEGHVIIKRDNKLKFAQRIERFLAQHLGGRAGAWER